MIFCAFLVPAAIACSSGKKDSDKKDRDQKAGQTAPGATGKAPADSPTPTAKQPTAKSDPAASGTSGGDQTCKQIEDGSLDCAESSRQSPFTCVRYNEDCSVDVQLAGAADFYRLKSIDGIAADALVQAAKKGCKDGRRNWKKRLAEDLSMVMQASCGQLDGDVDLVLENLESKQEITRKGVASNDDNRKAAKDCWEKNDKCTAP